MGQHHPLRGEPYKVLGQQRDVFGAFRQWRKVDGYDAQPVEEIFAEGSPFDGCFQVLPGGGADQVARAARAAVRGEASRLDNGAVLRAPVAGIRSGWSLGPLTPGLLRRFRLVGTIRSPLWSGCSAVW